MTASGLLFVGTGKSSAVCFVLNANSLGPLKLTGSLRSLGTITYADDDRVVVGEGRGSASAHQSIAISFNRDFISPDWAAQL